MAASLQLGVELGDQAGAVIGEQDLAAGKEGDGITRPRRQIDGHDAAPFQRQRRGRRSCIRCLSYRFNRRGAACRALG